MNQGLAYFPGIQQLLSASYTCSHGISPSVAVLTIAPQENFEGEGGTLSFLFGGVEIDLPDCKIDRHSFERNDAGLVWRLQIFDRRWKWGWGQVSGRYNLRNDDFSLKTATQQTPRQLATPCLQAMGEQGYDVSQMPNDSRPTIEWDYESPAAALAALCDSLGCRVVLSPLTNNVTVQVVGQGNNLPTDSLIDNSLTIDPPEQPDSLGIVCGPDRYQFDFGLKAMGIEEDGSLQPIDNLSYKPSGGWGQIDLPAFGQVAEPYRDRAKESVFRYYQIQMTATLPDYGKVTQLQQILPLETEQVETITKTNSSTGVTTTTNKPAQVYGTFYRGTCPANLSNTIQYSKINPNTFQADGCEYKRGFRIDRDRGLVIFDDYVFANSDDTGNNTPTTLTRSGASLYFRVAVSVADPITLAIFRYTKVRSYGNQFGTQTQYLTRPDIVMTHVPVYDSQFNISKVTTNRSQVDQECNYYLDNAEQDYQTTFPQTIHYAGLRADIDLDGAIQQITYEISAAGATTTACRNDEQVHRFPSYKERRALEKQRSLGQLQTSATPTIQRQTMKRIPRNTG